MTLSRAKDPGLPKYKIGQVASYLGVPVSTVRFYTNTMQPLIRPSRSNSGHHLYSLRQVELLQVALFFARRMSLSEVKERLADIADLAARQEQCSVLEVAGIPEDPKSLLLPEHPGDDHLEDLKRKLGKANRELEQARARIRRLEQRCKDLKAEIAGYRTFLRTLASDLIQAITEIETEVDERSRSS